MIGRHMFLPTSKCTGNRIAHCGLLLLIAASQGAVTQAATLVESFDPGLGQLVSISFDTVSGNLFVYPAHNASIFELDTSGNQVNTIPRPGASTNDNDLDFSHGTLQVGAVTVPANSLLMFNGDDSPNRLWALDKATGAILADVALEASGTVGGTHFPGTNLVATTPYTNRLIVIHNAADGLQVDSLPPGPSPFTVYYGDLDCAQSSGNIFMVGSSQNVIRELTQTGLCERDIDVEDLGISGMSGVAIDDDTGRLWVSSTNGIIYHVDVTPTPYPDSDGDGLTDDADNCIDKLNANQRDTDGDGIGNVCDPDLTNDCIVNFSDLNRMKQVFFSSDADADFDGSGLVNFIDLNVMKAYFFGPPGPSGAPNTCGCGI